VEILREGKEVGKSRGHPPDAAAKKRVGALANWSRPSGVKGRFVGGPAVAGIIGGFGERGQEVLTGTEGSGQGSTVLAKRQAEKLEEAWEERRAARAKFIPQW